jgi:c-di-GMP-binding flagellar brake protein YcgR
VFQRRKFPRVSKSYHVSYTTVDKEQFEANPISSLAVNISGGGLCFEATEALEKDTLVALEITSDTFRSTILALARVVWCKQRGNTHEVGAEFWWIGWRDNQAQTTIAEFIASKTTAQKVSA